MSTKPSINRVAAACFLLCGCPFTASAQGIPSPRSVDVMSADGTSLKATFFGAGKPGPGVLLLHQSNRDRKSWDSVAAQVAGAGINALTLDMRGYGESGGKKRSPAPEDIDAALKFLWSQPGVDRNRAAIGGAGWLGVIDGVDAARRHPAEVKSLVLMSGETERDGMEFLRKATELPELFVFSDADEYPPTQDAMKLLYVTAGGRGKKLVHYSSPEDAPWLWYETSDASRVPAHGGHGTDMFGAHPELPGIIVHWFVTTLVNTPGHAPVDALSAAPILNQLQHAGGAALARQQLTQARRRDPHAQLWPEVAVDLIGEHYQRGGDLKSAIETFKLNLVAYPDSADAHFNLADAYLAAGEKGLARQYAEKALSMLDSHKAPLSSWSDTDERRGEIRKEIQRVLKDAHAGGGS
jgi:tetratricopeptide (TPR) repeat protein